VTVIVTVGVSAAFGERFRERPSGDFEVVRVVVGALRAIS